MYTARLLVICHNFLYQLIAFICTVHQNFPMYGSVLNVCHHYRFTKETSGQITELFLSTERK